MVCEPSPYARPCRENGVTPFYYLSRVFENKLVTSQLVANPPSPLPLPLLVFYDLEIRPQKRPECQCLCLLHGAIGIESVLRGLSVLVNSRITPPPLLGGEGGVV